MRQFIQQVLVDRWWIWVFILFFIVLFQTGKEQEEPEILQTSAPIIQDAVIAPTDKQIQNKNELREKEKNRIEQQKILQKKWDVKNGIILTTDLTLDTLSQKIQEQFDFTEKPILHATNSTIYYEYSVAEHFNVHATALAENHLIKNITVQIKEQESAQDIFKLIVSSVSPEIGEEEAILFLEKMKNGEIHKFQTKYKIVYQWSALGESSILTVMKEKETQANQTP